MQTSELASAVLGSAIVELISTPDSLLVAAILAGVLIFLGLVGMWAGWADYRERRDLRAKFFEEDVTNALIAHRAQQARVQQQVRE